MKTTAIIAAGGIGKRFNSTLPKQFILLAGKPIIVHTLEVFENSSVIDEIIVVCVKDYLNYCHELVKKFGLQKVKKIIVGADERQSSIYNAVKNIDDANFICVHDAARPFVKDNLITETIIQCKNNDGCICALNVHDTIKVCNDYVEKTLPREKIFLAQTPQTFKAEILKMVYEKAMMENFFGTDDSSLLEHYGYKIKVIAGNAENFKITEPLDLLLAESLLTKCLIKGDKNEK